MPTDPAGVFQTDDWTRVTCVHCALSESSAPESDHLARLAVKVDELEAEAAKLRTEVRDFRVRMGLPPDMETEEGQ